MRKKLVRNLGLKLASLFLAFVLWFLVVQINDPLDSVTFNNVEIGLKATQKLDGVEFLHTKSFAVAHKSAGILGVESVLGAHGHIAGAISHYPLHRGHPLGEHKLGQVVGTLAVPLGRFPIGICHRRRGF